MNELNLNWPKTAIFLGVLACISFLVWAGKVPPEYLKYLFCMILPSPLFDRLTKLGDAG